MASSSGPTARGRFWAAALGVLLSGYATLYMLQDFQLVRRLDDPNAANGEKRKFKVSFQPSEPLRLKPEAQAKLDRYKLEVERIEREKALKSENNETPAKS